MAKKASAKGSAAGRGKAAPKTKKAAPKAKKAAAKPTKAPKPKRSASAASAKRGSRPGAGASKAKSTNAADALIALVESPLVADLLAAAVTAAASTMLEHRLKSRRGRETGSVVRSVGAAAAAAVGKQLAAEFEEIRKAAEEAKSGKSG